MQNNLNVDSKYYNSAEYHSPNRSTLAYNRKNYTHDPSIGTNNASIHANPILKLRNYAVVKLRSYVEQLAGVTFGDHQLETMDHSKNKHLKKTQTVVNGLAQPLIHSTSNKVKNNLETIFEEPTELEMEEDEHNLFIKAHSFLVKKIGSLVLESVRSVFGDDIIAHLNEKKSEQLKNNLDQ